jgi:hypothetical protein
MHTDESKDDIQNRRTFASSSSCLVSTPYSGSLVPLKVFNLATKYINTFTEYHSVCSFFRIGTPHPLSRKRVCSPLPRSQRGGGHTRLRVRGPNSDDWRKSQALCLPCESSHKANILNITQTQQQTKPSQAKPKPANKLN